MLRIVKDFHQAPEITVTFVLCSNVPPLFSGGASVRGQKKTVSSGRGAEERLASLATPEVGRL